MAEKHSDTDTEVGRWPPPPPPPKRPASRVATRPSIHAVDADGRDPSTTTPSPPN